MLNIVRLFMRVVCGGGAWYGCDMKKRQKQFFIYGKNPVQEMVATHPEKILKVSFVKKAKQDEQAFAGV